MSQVGGDGWIEKEAGNTLDLEPKRRTDDEGEKKRNPTKERELGKEDLLWEGCGGEGRTGRVQRGGGLGVYDETERQWERGSMMMRLLEPESRCSSSRGRASQGMVVSTLREPVNLVLERAFVLPDELRRVLRMLVCAARWG